MSQAGFYASDSQWWHYEDPGYASLPVLDIDLPAWTGALN